MSLSRAVCKVKISVWIMAATLMWPSKIYKASEPQAPNKKKERKKSLLRWWMCYYTWSHTPRPSHGPTRYPPVHVQRLILAGAARAAYRSKDEVQRSRKGIFPKLSIIDTIHSDVS